MRSAFGHFGGLCWCWRAEKDAAKYASLLRINKCQSETVDGP